jgi:very-short-patch-repair endonuclease
MKRSAKYKKLYKKAKKRAFKTALSNQQDLVKYAKKMSGKMTAPERIFKSILKKYNVKFEPQFILQGKIFDYYLPESKTLVEIQGDYWHGNPEVYEEFSGYQNHIKQKDVFKRAIAIGMGYDFLEYWEKDLHDNKDVIIQELKTLEIIKKETI